MASRSIGGVFAELTLRDAKFRGGIKKAGAALKKFGGMAIKAGAVAAGAMAAGLVVGTKKTIAMGAELDHLSSQTGVAVADLMRIQQAYKDNGKSAESAGKDINKMQRAIKEAADDPGGSMDFFAEMGLSAAKLMEMNPTQQFEAIGKAINGVENRTKRTALAMDIFGRSGGQLLTVFSGSNMDDVNTSLGRMPEIMQEFSGEMERADTLLGRLPNKSDQFFAGFTGGIINQLIPSLETVNGFDFTTLGESLGKSLGDVIAHAAFLIGTLMDIPEYGFSGAIDRNSAAFDLIKQEQDEAAAERKRIANEELAYAAARRQEHLAAPDFIEPIVEKAAIAKVPNMRESDRNIDDYQRSGLSLSKDPGKVQDKVLKVQQEIRDILNSAKTDGQLNWAM